MRFVFFISIAVLLIACDKSEQASSLSSAFTVNTISGNASDYGRALAIDGDGNIIFAGYSNSTNLSFDYSQQNTKSLDGIKADYDVIIGKYLISEKRIITAVLGGSEDDRAYAVAIDADNRIYVAGMTISLDFPQTFGPDENRQQTDIFISILSPDLNQLISSRVIPGNGYDTVRDIAIDPQGAVYLAGSTASADFPVTTGSLMTVIPERGDSPFDIGLSGFVMKLSANLQEIQASTFIGGKNGDDQIYALVLSRDGDVYITGNTSSETFPVTAGAFDQTHNGSVDIIIARLDASLRTLIAGTYFGEPHYQYGRDITLDESGDVYLVGEVHNLNGQNAVYPGAAQHIFGGGLNDVQVIRFDASLTEIRGITYLGAKNDEYARSVLTQGDNVIVTGYTSSIFFPPLTLDKSQIQGGTYDMYTVILNKELTEIKEHYRIGGRENDFAYDMIIDDGAKPVIVGNSNSRSFAMTGMAADKEMNLVLISLPVITQGLVGSVEDKSADSKEVNRYPYIQ